MKRFEVFSGYRQFYVADAEIQQEAPDVWTQNNIVQRHNTLQYLTALCPEGDISARIISCGPNESLPVFLDRAEFEVQTEIEVPSGKIGVYGWPRELRDEYFVEPGFYVIHFRGYALAKVESEQDYYGVEIRKRG